MAGNGPVGQDYNGINTGKSLDQSEDELSMLSFDWLTKSYQIKYFNHFILVEVTMIKKIFFGRIMDSN